MSWTTYRKYVTELSNTDINDTKELVAKYFPNIRCKTPRSCFHNSVMKMFETPVGHAEGLSILKDLYQQYVAFIPNPVTRRGSLSKVRKVIKRVSPALYSDSLKDEYFNINFAERTAIANKSKKRVTNLNNDKLQVDMKLVFSKMTELSLSTNPYERIILVMLCTGSRPSEVFYKSTFKAEAKSEIKISGLAKKREGQINWVVKPVLFQTPKFIVEAVEHIRNHFKGKTVVKNGALAADKNATLNKWVVKHFPFLKMLTNKASYMRKIYC